MQSMSKGWSLWSGQGGKEIFKRRIFNLVTGGMDFLQLIDIYNNIFLIKKDIVIYVSFPAGINYFLFIISIEVQVIPYGNKCSSTFHIGCTNEGLIGYKICLGFITLIVILCYTKNCCF